jgi:hypothetical protein
MMLSPLLDERESFVAVLRGEQRHRRFGTGQLGAEALLEIEADLFLVVAQISDRGVSAADQLEVAAAQAHRDPAGQRRSPDHRAIDQLPEVLHDRIATIADRARERGERRRAERYTVRAADARLAQLFERFAHGAGQQGRVGRERDARIRGAADQPGDVRFLVTVEQRRIFGGGKHSRGVAQRIEVDARRAAIDPLELRAFELEGNPQLDHRPHDSPAKRGSRALEARERLHAPEIDRGVLPAERALEVDETPRGEVQMQDVARLLLDARPAAFTDRRELAVQTDHPASASAARRLPMRRLPFPLELRRELPLALSSSSFAIGPSENKNRRRNSSNFASWRRIHSSTMHACSFSSSRLCARTAASSASSLASIRCAYQSTASSSSIRERNARCISRVSTRSASADS